MPAVLMQLPPPLFPWSSRTVGDSHESSPVVSVISHHHCSFDVLTTPHQDVVGRGPPSCRSSWLSFSFHYPNISVFSSRSSGILQIWPNSWSFLFRMMSITVLSLHSSFHFVVRYVILPSDFQHTSVTSHLERQQPTLIVFPDGSCFRCV